MGEKRNESCPATNQFECPAAKTTGKATECAMPSGRVKLNNMH